MRQRQCDTVQNRTWMCEDDITLLMKLYETLKLPLEFLYFLMERERDNTFVAILIQTSPEEDMHALLQNNKRGTDLLFEIDRQEGMYALICQGTRVDGGYRFVERLIKNVMKELTHKTYFIELEVASTKYDLKTLLFILFEMYLKAREQNRSGEIIYKSIY